jgi:hypothetical protein
MARRRVYALSITPAKTQIYGIITCSMRHLENSTGGRATWTVRACTSKPPASKQLRPLNVSLLTADWHYVAQQATESAPR